MSNLFDPDDNGQQKPGYLLSLENLAKRTDQFARKVGVGSVQWQTIQIAKMRCVELTYFDNEEGEYPSVYLWAAGKHDGIPLVRIERSANMRVTMENNAELLLAYLSFIDDADEEDRPTGEPATSGYQSAEDEN